MNLKVKLSFPKFIAMENLGTAGTATVNSQHGKACGLAHLRMTTAFGARHSAGEQAKLLSFWRTSALGIRHSAKYKLSAISHQLLVKNHPKLTTRYATPASATAALTGTPATAGGSAKGNHMHQLGSWLTGGE